MAGANFPGHVGLPAAAAAELQARLGEGLAFHRNGQLEPARQAYLRALAAQPDHPEVLQCLGIVEAQSGHHRQAVMYLTKAVEANPLNPMALANLGGVFLELGQCQDALHHYDRAVALKPDYLNAIVGRGRAQAALGQVQAAMADFQKVLALNPQYADAYSHLGQAWMGLQRYQEAHPCFEKAVSLNPRSAEYAFRLGLSFHKLKNLAAALQCYQQSLAMNPGFLDAQFHLGLALSETDAPELAAKAFEQLVAVQPDRPYLRGMLLHAKMLACDWAGLDALRRGIQDDVARGQRVVEPFGYQAACDDEASLQSCARIFAADKYPAAQGVTPLPPKAPAGKIRIGYLCGEFREQATAILMTELWECHDKRMFETYAFDNGWNDHSPRRQRIERAFDAIIPIADLSDADVAQRIRDEKIDILVNLNGYFGRSRQAVFAMRPCALQVNYLGFPGTLGADYIDYIVADRFVIPPASYPYYTEKVISLPGCYQVNDGQRTVADRVFTRAELNLPQDGFVFCCFNNTYKITPELFAAWMRILRQVDNSVLWLIEANAAAVQNLAREASAAGVDPGRIVFARRTPLPEHLARHRAADLFLDTTPYNAHTTASDALWAGLPVLTTQGKTFPGRVAQSLLHAVGLPELVAPSLDAYEDMAIALARDRERLDTLRQKLRTLLPDAPLFDARTFTRHLESAFWQIHARCCAGAAPEHLRVEG